MASRKICESCGENFGKSSYYAHLPCKYSRDIKSGCIKEYVFCDHCNKKVAKKTYYDHQAQQNHHVVNFDLLNELPSHSVDCSYTCSSGKEGQVQSDSSDTEMSCEEEFFSDLGENFPNQDESMSIENGEDDNSNSNEEFEYCDDDSEQAINQNDDENLFSESYVLILFILLWQSIYKVSDRGIEVLLKFLCMLFTMIGEVSKVETLINFAKFIPSSLYMAKSWLGLGKDEFEKFAVCPKCMTLYKIEDCTKTKSNGHLVSSKCSHVSFPNHPQRSKRTQCGTLLMKKMRSKNGSIFLHPKRLYCFRKLSDSLKELLYKPGLLEACETWRSKTPQQNGAMGDSFDGNIWKEFKDVNGELFFKKPGNLGVMLNVDWFQPYKHTQYSCGVLYLVLMNLPREERFKQENVMIVGIIPGPNEPKGNINTFLQPLVNDLIDLWDGVILDNAHSLGGLLKVKVALLALCCDIPAARKCGGFAGHSASKGCNKCFRTFTQSAFGSKPDFSGFNIDDWEKRTNELHRHHAESIQMATCPAQVKKIVHETGSRYSVLLELPYFNAVRFTVIDPMHNLFLGLAKKTLKLWIEKGIINDKDLQIIQKRVNAVIPPPEIGRIPAKIASGFAGFTADQWKNWVCYYSVFALKNILPKKNYKAWLHLVCASRLICSKHISPEECSQAQEEIIQFCRAFEKLYGPESCTPNMHLSCHLIDCIRDYGPVYSFWCFSFERYNGILGSYHKSNHNIEIQLMRKFLRDLHLRNIQFPDDFGKFQGLLKEKQSGSVGETTVYHDADEITPCPPIKRIALDQEDSEDLKILYQRLYPNETMDCLRLCDSFSRISVSGTIYQSTNHLGVIAQWLNGEIRPGRVCRFLNHSVIMKNIDGKRRKGRHLIAEIDWFKKHPELQFYPKPFEVWSSDIEEHSFIPVEKILSKCILVNYKVKFTHGIERVNVIIPIIRHM